MPEVDAQHRYVAIADEMNGAEQGAIATDGEEKVVVDTDGQSVGYLLSINTIAVQPIGEELKLLSQRRFKVADVEGYFH